MKYPHDRVEERRYPSGAVELVIATGPGVLRKLRRMAARVRAEGGAAFNIEAVSRAGQPCASIHVQLYDGKARPAVQLMGLWPDRLGALRARRLTPRSGAKRSAGKLEGWSRVRRLKRRRVQREKSMASERVLTQFVDAVWGA